MNASWQESMILKTTHHASIYIFSAFSVSSIFLLVGVVDEETRDEFDRDSLRQHVNHKNAWRHEQNATLQVDFSPASRHKIVITAIKGKIFVKLPLIDTDVGCYAPWEFVNIFAVLVQFLREIFLKYRKLKPNGFT